MQSDFKGATLADIEDVQDLTLKELEGRLNAAEARLQRAELDVERNPGDVEELEILVQHYREELVIARQQFANARQKAPRPQPVATVAT